MIFRNKDFFLHVIHLKEFATSLLRFSEARVYCISHIGELCMYNLNYCYKYNFFPLPIQGRIYKTPNWAKGNGEYFENPRIEKKQSEGGYF